MNDVLIRKKNEKTTTFQTHKKAFCFLEWADELLIGLDKRTRQIIKKRFGLLDDQSETLEKIGQQYNITRERVRQIILKASKHILAKLESEHFKKAEEKILFTINQNSGIIKEIDIFEKFNLNDKKEANAIKFFV
ncbi:MAG TPA: hypothetical protein ENL05_00225, partial [Candidatus Moranbacteria bacterium]|nr:hypothetical protein [Candidatus Moranbacteria bacterium]